MFIETYLVVLLITTPCIYLYHPHYYPRLVQDAVCHLGTFFSAPIYEALGGSQYYHQQSTFVK